MPTDETQSQPQQPVAPSTNQEKALDNLTEHLRPNNYETNSKIMQSMVKLAVTTPDPKLRIKAIEGLGNFVSFTLPPYAPLDLRSERHPSTSDAIKELQQLQLEAARSIAAISFLSTPDQSGIQKAAVQALSKGLSMPARPDTIDKSDLVQIITIIGSTSTDPEVKNMTMEVLSNFASRPPSGADRVANFNAPVAGVEDQDQAKASVAVLATTNRPEQPLPPTQTPAQEAPIIPIATQTGN